MAEPKTLYVRRDVTNAAEIVRHYRAQGVAVTEADELHVTIIHSRAPVDWMAVEQSWQEDITVTKGGPRMTEMFNGGALVLLFSPDQLKWRHEQMIEAGATYDHDEYRPHITISYAYDGDPGDVEPWQGRISLGPEIFEEVKQKTSAELLA